jgi:peptidase E
MAAVAALDAHHLERVRQVHADFDEKWTPHGCEALGRARTEVEEQLEGCGGVAMAGGHVVVLLNRLRLLNMTPLLAGRPLVAWSAGAMVLTRQVVLFHDSPPQGFGDPEVLESGLGLCPGVVALPHARRRLRLNDPVRVAIFARRFSPDTCMALDENCRADWNGTEWKTWGRTRRLDLSGNIMKMAAP